MKTLVLGTVVLSVLALQTLDPTAPVVPVPILPVGPGAAINALVLFFATLATLISTWLTHRLSTQRDKNAQAALLAQLAAAAAERAAERIAATETAERQRKWDLEDRQRLAAKVEETKRVQAATHQDLSRQIEANTQISTQAFSEANNFNLKLRDILAMFGEEQQERLRQHDANEARLRDIAQTMRRVEQQGVLPKQDDTR